MYFPYFLSTQDCFIIMSIHLRTCLVEQVMNQSTGLHETLL
jgi:hypothetical protein